MGFSKSSTDLSIKHITFEVDGEKHTISFKFSHRKGIRDVIFDCKEAKIIDAYPALPDLLKMLPPIMYVELHLSIKRILRKMKSHIRSI